MENTRRQKPLRVIRCGRLEAAVWRDTRNKDGREIDVYSIKISKSYKDKNTGNWKNTDWLYLEDLPRLATLANETYRQLCLHTWQPQGQANQGCDEQPNPDIDETAYPGDEEDLNMPF